MPWKKMLAWAAGQIEPLLLQKLEFVLEENRVYRALLDRHVPHWRLTNPKRIALAEQGMPLGQWVGYHPILNIQSIAYLSAMKNRIIVTSVAMSALALSFLLVGCDRQVSSEKTSTVSGDGTVKSQEKTVTKSSDGTVSKTEESKKTTPPENP